MALAVGLASLLVLAAVALPQLLLSTAAAASGGTATRTLPATATCGETIEVSLAVDPPTGTDAWLLDEVPPSEVEIGNVDPDPNGEADAGHASWVSTSGDAATVTYNVTIPADTPDGTQLAFDGEYRFHDSMSSRADVSGDDVVTVACGSVERSLPATAGCGETVEVTLTVDAASTDDAWLIDEVPPAALSVTDIDAEPNGGLEAGHVSWVSTSGDDAVVTYNVTVPSDAQDGTVYAFAGEQRLFPSMDARAGVTGDDALTVDCQQVAQGQLHPFDTNGDCLFSESELFSLIDGWKSSSADQAPMDGHLFDGIEHWKLLPEPYCGLGG